MPLPATRVVALALSSFALLAGVLEGRATAVRSAPTGLPGFAGCGGPGVRPDSILLGCGDGGQSLFDLRWSTWTADDARATGEWWQNLCTPDCVAGRGVTAHVTVQLLRARTCSDHELQFTRLKLAVVGKRPAVDANVTAITMKSPFLIRRSVRCP
jgi:hypothetical protein